MRTQKELVERYENKLEKVKDHHNPEKARTEIGKIKSKEYIEFAEQELLAVKNGRNW